MQSGHAGAAPTTALTPWAVEPVPFSRGHELRNLVGRASIKDE